jgi:hypothetical protein
MPDTRDHRSARGSILSSLSALGAAQPSEHSDTLPRKILGTLAAAGASLAAVQSAEAGIVDYNPNVSIGFAAGNASKFTLNIPSLAVGSIKLTAPILLNTNVVWFKANGAAAHFRTERVFIGAPSFHLAATVPAGKKFSTIGSGSRRVSGAVFAGGVFTDHINSIPIRPNFSDQYFAFTFEDASSETHYGWMYGSLSGTYTDISYNLISYAYDTTPDEVIETGQGQLPEPSTLVLGAMAALVLGAAGVRRWKKDLEAATKVD